MSEAELWREIKKLQNQVEQMRTREISSQFLPFANYSSLGSQGVGVNQYFALASVQRIYTLLRWEQSVFVDSVNNGSNYWTIQIDDAAMAFASFNTSASAAGTWLKYTITSFAQPNAPPPNGYYGIECFKTGAPGALTWAGPSLRVI